MAIIRPKKSGTDLAAKRLAAKRKANRLIPHIDRPNSRQVERRMQMDQATAELHRQKRVAMELKLLGGAACVR